MCIKNVRTVSHTAFAIDVQAPNKKRCPGKRRGSTYVDFRNADLVAVRGIRRLASILNLWGVTLDQLASCRFCRKKTKEASVVAGEGGSGVTFAT